MFCSLQVEGQGSVHELPCSLTCYSPPRRFALQFEQTTFSFTRFIDLLFDFQRSRETSRRKPRRRSSSVCVALFRRCRTAVEARGLEPLTLGLQSRCSTN